MRKREVVKTKRTRNWRYVRLMTLHQLATSENKQIHLLNKALNEPDKLTELNEEGHSPLVSAVISGRWKNVLILAGCGADVNVRFRIKVVDLQVGMLNGCRFPRSARQELFDNLGRPEVWVMMTPLHYAVMMGDENMVAALCYMGADVVASVSHEDARWNGSAKDFAKKFLSVGENGVELRTRVMDAMKFPSDFLLQWDSSLFSVFLKKHREWADSTIVSRLSCLGWVEAFYNHSPLYKEYGEWLNLNNNHLHKVIQLLKESPKVQEENNRIGGTLIPTLQDYEEYVVKYKRLKKSGL